MTDAWLATVVSYDPATKTAKVLPLIVENDGTDHVQVSANPVAGTYPEAGDTVLVLTARNNLDDKKISRFFDSSEMNGRIIHVVKSLEGVYRFKGNYRIDGNLEVNAPDVITFVVGDTLTFEVTVENDTITFSMNGMDFEIKASPVNGLLDIIQANTGRSAFADGFMTAFGPTVSRIPGGNP